MVDSQRADAVICDHVAYSMGAAMIPVPIGDVLAITALQVDLVKALATLYEQDFTDRLGKMLVTSLTGTSVARLGASAIKGIPGVGTIVGSAAQIILAGASTYAIGHLFKSHFAAGGNLDTFIPEKARELYDQYVERGRSVAEEQRRQQEEPKSVHALAETIQKLSDLRDAGDLTRAEFDELKRKLIAGSEG